MTDRTQFEAMLEALINEDQETAKEIFHNIVVAKSREIYEELLESDFQESSEEEEEGEEESVEEGENPFAGAEEEEGEEGEEEEEGGDDAADDESDDIGGDATDDFIDDAEAGDEEEGTDGELEDRVMDIEDALEELKAEFEELLSQEADEEGHDMAAIDAADGEEGDDAFGGDEFGGEEEGEEEFDELAGLMEYVNKVNPPKHGDNGANTKSIVASKNDMGGTTANILKGGTENGVEANKGNLKGNGVFKGGPAKEENAGNVNVPGNKSAPKLSNVPAGHGAEKKGKSETADKSAGSPLNGAPKRAK